MAILQTERAACNPRVDARRWVADLLFPSLSLYLGCAQNSFHHLDVWDHTLETVRLVGVVGSEKSGCLLEFTPEIDQYLGQEIVKARPNARSSTLPPYFTMPANLGSRRSILTVASDFSATRKFPGRSLNP